MKPFFKDIFEYHHHFNQKLIEQLIENKNSISEQTIQRLSHSINAHQIWNARITEKETIGVHQVHSLEESKRIDNENYKNTIEIIENQVLTVDIAYRNSKGKKFNNTIKEILFHISNHFSHHKGQIIAELRQSGINPIVTDYIFYKR